MIIDQSGFSGNERQLKVLMKAIREENIKSWNSFVKKSGVGFKADLKGINLSDFNLREVNFANADLTKADFTGSDLRRANLSGAKLRKASFHSANLQYCRFIKADLKETNFSKSNLNNSNLSNSYIKETDFAGSSLKSANFTGTNIKDISLKNVNLKNIIINKNIKIRPKVEKNKRSEEDIIRSPWLIAQEKEQKLKEIRIIEEKKKKQEIDDKIQRKLGIKSEKWKPV